MARKRPKLAVLLLTVAVVTLIVVTHVRSRHIEAQELTDQVVFLILQAHSHLEDAVALADRQKALLAGLDLARLWTVLHSEKDIRMQVDSSNRLSGHIENIAELLIFGGEFSGGSLVAASYYREPLPQEAAAFYQSLSDLLLDLALRFYDSGVNADNYQYARVRLASSAHISHCVEQFRLDAEQLLAAFFAG